MTLSEKIFALAAAAAGGGGFSMLVKSLLERNKTGAEAHKADADANKAEAEGEAITIGALRDLQVKLFEQVISLASQVHSLQQMNAELMLKNAEMSVQIAVQQETNRRLVAEAEQSKVERQAMQEQINSLQQHVRQLERGSQS
jgi:RecA/RadA recombinase